MSILLATQKPFSKETELEIYNLLKESGYELIIPENSLKETLIMKRFPKINGLIVRSDIVDEEVLNMFPDLKIIVRAGSGYDNINLAECSKRGIIVETTPGANSNAVAELIFGLLLQHIRNYFTGTVGYELRGKNFGIVGYGNIGRILANIAIGFGMNVYVYDPIVNAHIMEIIKTNNINYVNSVGELFQKCEHISLNLPLNQNTAKSIGYDLIMSMPKNAVLMNTARGGIIDSEGLRESFMKREDLIYISDVELDCKEWIETYYPKRCYFTSTKQGAQTAEANMNAGIAAANQVIEFFQTGVAKFRVN